MANTDAPFGFVPYGKLLSADWYPVVASYATAIFVGDWVEITNTGLVCKIFDGETRMGVEIDATGAAGDELGAVLAILDHNGDPVKYLPASSAGDGVVAGYVLVADHPLQEYLVQEDGETTPIAAASVGLNVAMISTHSGSTVTGRSKQEIDSDSVNTTNTLALRILRSYKDDTVGSAYCRWIVQPNPNAHFKSSATAI
jgi:hypothetical protein